MGLCSRQRENSMCVTQYGRNEVWSQRREEKRRAVENGNNGKWSQHSHREWKAGQRETSSSTCASGKATSMMFGWPRGSPFSSREKMTWYPRIWPCCFTCRGGFQVTRMAVELMASTSSFLGGAPGTGSHKKKGGEGEGRENVRVRQTLREGVWKN